ncbi:methyltransferase [Seminavis robusta]|uniref:tRNA (guanine(37)-N1)-methyltransferase n=1 Tax=Seminavis robusta TaxID=568900 RepID=A0A9N8EMQ0_9STRA|nr:methyltransferase [Seminavis robusta]|eukprot:Sro1272_g258210.1 methyltransferase (562) ;mRNA; f:11881-13566
MISLLMITTTSMRPNYVARGFTIFTRRCGPSSRGYTTLSRRSLAWHTRHTTFVRASISLPQDQREYNQTTTFQSKSQKREYSPSRTIESSGPSEVLSSIQHYNDDEEVTADNWREHPDLNPTLTFPTWAVPLEHASVLQTLLSSELTQPFLATRHELLQQCHPRPKIVQDGDKHKYILLDPQQQQEKQLPTDLINLLQQHHVQLQGPDVTIRIRYHQLPMTYILHKVLPPHVHPPPTAFETVGHVAHLNLREHHIPFAKLIGQVLLEKSSTIETVIHKVGQVNGPFRTYDYQLLAGRNDTICRVMEHGIQMELDLAKVYWSSRLAQERQVVLEQEIREGQVIADAFSGVGAICLLAARDKNCTIFANDWNPQAIHYLKRNFATNRLRHHLVQSTHQDAYEFLMDLGLSSSSCEELEDDEEEATASKSSKTTHLVDHVLMNFPLKAPTFLGALRWWSPPLSEHSPRLHVYTFARADAKTGRSAQDVAIDIIASELLPPMGLEDDDNDDDDDGGCHHRQQELNDEYGCQVVAREVRDVAPGKLVFCVSFTATPELLRVMQGSF